MGVIICRELLGENMPRYIGNNRIGSVQMPPCILLTMCKDSSGISLSFQFYHVTHIQTIAYETVTTAARGRTGKTSNVIIVSFYKSRLLTPYRLFNLCAIHQLTILEASVYYPVSVALSIVGPGRSDLSVGIIRRNGQVEDKLKTQHY